VLARSALAGTAILAPLGIAVALVAAQFYAAARRFRRIVTTSGVDIHNLMSALDEMAAACRVQRWRMTVLAAILVALATTRVSR